MSNQTHILKKDQVKLGSDLRLLSIAIIILPLLLVTISISVIDCANRVATFLRLSSILKLCVTKIALCNILLVKLSFMHFEEVLVSVSR